MRENLTRLLLLIGDGRPQMLMENAEKYRRYNERTKQMLTFIKRHFGEELSVRDIADSASISESECLRCFRKILDTSCLLYTSFTNKAREAAREGTPITLIDGNDLIRLVVKYELFITPITTYVLDDFYLDD